MKLLALPRSNGFEFMEHQFVASDGSHKKGFSQPTQHVFTLFNACPLSLFPAS
jgi:hypothetical protein